MNAKSISKTAMVVAGGTGGHIFPAMAVAKALKNAGWRIVWVGTLRGMESSIVPANDLAFCGIEFSGLRGKGFGAWLNLPIRISKAFVASLKIIKHESPNVILGFGGYVTFPVGFVGSMWGVPVLLHEQNSVAGLSNRVLSLFAKRVYTAFPDVFPHGVWIGNPIRAEFNLKEAPEERFNKRTGPLRILVIGGSLGAAFLNDILPKTIAMLPAKDRPQLTHQTGVTKIDEARANYVRSGVEAELVPFIDNMAEALANADLVICRSGASTVTEVTAIGVACLFIPLPSAVDDHQTRNAMHLVRGGAGRIQTQSTLSPEKLYELIQSMDRTELVGMAMAAKRMHKAGAIEVFVKACEEDKK